MNTDVQAAPLGHVPRALPLLGGAGALGLAVAEFLPLLHVTTGDRVVTTVHTGSHHSYAQLLVAVAVGVAVIAASKSGRRLPVLALGALGVAALVIALGGDLSDTQASGLLSGFRRAHASPQAGLWVELVAGLLVLLAAAAGLLLTPSSRERTPPVHQARGMGGPAAGH